MLPKISIVTPSWNQGSFLEETIQSVLGQNYANLEYQIIDGGSNDNSIEVIKKYASQLTHWLSEKDNGQAHAINKGFARVTGDIVTWLNSDDQLTSGTLEKVAYYFLQYPDVMMIHGRTILFGDNRPDIIRGAENRDLANKYLAGMPFSQPSAFFRRRVLEEQGYLNETLHYGLDYDLFIRIALNYDILKVEETFSKYLLHANSKTVQNNLGFAQEWALVFSKLLRSFSFTTRLITDMKELGLYVAGEDRYLVRKHWEQSFIEKSFLYFLCYQAYYYYEAMQVQEVKKITSFIKRKNYSFFKQNNLESMHQRSKYVHPKVLQLIRNLIR
jgi:glycosyltransferase involved in cell wall biosynthesis